MHLCLPQALAACMSYIMNPLDDALKKLNASIFLSTFLLNQQKTYYNSKNLMFTLLI